MNAWLRCQRFWAQCPSAVIMEFGDVHKRYWAPVACPTEEPNNMGTGFHLLCYPDFTLLLKRASLLPRLASDRQLCLCRLNAGITGVCHYTQLEGRFLIKCPIITFKSFFLLVTNVQSYPSHCEILPSLFSSIIGTLIILYTQTCSLWSLTDRTWQSSLSAALTQWKQAGCHDAENIKDLFYEQWTTPLNSILTHASEKIEKLKAVNFFQIDFKGPTIKLLWLF